MQTHLYLPPVLVNEILIGGYPEAETLHPPQKIRRVRPARVGEEDLAPAREEARRESGQSRRVSRLVEHVRREDEIKTTEAFDLRRAPVQQRGLERPSGVQARVVSGEVEGGLVVVRREDLRAAPEGDDRRQPDAAAKLDGSPLGEVRARQVA